MDVAAAHQGAVLGAADHLFADRIYKAVSVVTRVKVVSVLETATSSSPEPLFAATAEEAA